MHNPDTMSETECENAIQALLKEYQPGKKALDSFAKESACTRLRILQMMRTTATQLELERKRTTH